ncbi:MAG: acyl carrier protein [Nitrospinae bacterium]|nr:acyl carrier protein [Nitrospinota bacterium]
MENIGERIKTILADEIEVDINNIHDDSKLVDLGVDSLTFLEMVAEFKDEFNVNISINEISEYLKDHPIRTAGELIKYVEEVILKETKT